MKLLALSISYSWNPNEQLGNVFILGPLNINKRIFVSTSIGGFGVKDSCFLCLYEHDGSRTRNDFLAKDVERSKASG